MVPLCVFTLFLSPSTGSSCTQRKSKGRVTVLSLPNKNAAPCPAGPVVQNEPKEASVRYGAYGACAIFKRGKGEGARKKEHESSKA